MQELSRIIIIVALSPCVIIALGIEPVTNLDVQVAPASLVMQVSWTRPIFLPRGLVGLTYYVELNSSLGAKIFTVSDSVKILIMNCVYSC